MREPAPKEDFGTLLSKHMKRRGISDLEELTKLLMERGYPRESVHPGVLINSMTDRTGTWRRNPAMITTIGEVLRLSPEEKGELTYAYVYRPPD